MTPTQLIDDLNLPEDKIARIKALSRSFMEFEAILHEHGGEHAADNPFRQGILAQSQECVDLIAQTLGQNPQTVLDSLLALFGITQEQFDNSCTMSNHIVALSAIVKAQYP